MSADIKDKLKGFSFLQKGRTDSALDVGDISKYREIPLSQIIAANHLETAFSLPSIYDCLRKYDNGLSRLLFLDAMLTHLKDKIPADQFLPVKDEVEKMLTSRENIDTILNKAASLYSGKIKNPQKFRDELEKTLYAQIEADFEKRIKPTVIKEKNAELKRATEVEADRVAIIEYTEDKRKADVQTAIDALKKELQKRARLSFDDASYTRGVLNDLEYKVKKQAEMQHRNEWTPEKKRAFIEETKAKLDDSARSQLDFQAKTEFKAEKKRELGTVKYFPLKRLVGWVAGLSLASIITISSANLYVMKGFYNKTMVKRPEIVALQDGNLEKILLIPEAGPVTSAKLKVNPDFPLPTYSEKNYFHNPRDSAVGKRFVKQMQILPTYDMPPEVQKAQMREKEALLQEIIKESPKSHEGINARLELARIYSYPVEFAKDQKYTLNKMLASFLKENPDSSTITTQMIVDLLQIHYRSQDSQMKDASAKASLEWFKMMAESLKGTHAGFELEYVIASAEAKKQVLSSVYPDEKNSIYLDKGFIDRLPEVGNAQIVKRYLASANGDMKRVARGYAMAAQYALSEKRPDEAINMSIRSLLADAGINPDKGAVTDVLPEMHEFFRPDEGRLKKAEWTGNNLLTLAMAYRELHDFDRANKVLKKTMELYKGTDIEMKSKQLMAGDFADEGVFLKDLLGAMKSGN